MAGKKKRGGTPEYSTPKWFSASRVTELIDKMLKAKLSKAGVNRQHALNGLLAGWIAGNYSFDKAANPDDVIRAAGPLLVELTTNEERLSPELAVVHQDNPDLYSLHIGECLTPKGRRLLTAIARVIDEENRSYGTFADTPTAKTGDDPTGDVAETLTTGQDAERLLADIEEVGEPDTPAEDPPKEPPESGSKPA